MAMNLFKRRPSDLMDQDPRMDDLRAKALNRTSEDSMRAYGGGTGTSDVPVGTVMVEEPGAATRAMSGVGTGSNVRMIGSEVVQPSDKRWDPAQVQTLMGEVSPEGRGRAAAVRAGSVAERLLGTVQSSGFMVQGSQPGTVNSEPGTLFYDENHFQTSSNLDPRFNKLQADYWRRNSFEKARAARTGFANLDDYDQWFRSIPNGKPGEFGDAMKQAYLDGMPPAIRDEFVERKNQIVTNRKEAGAAGAFSKASGVTVQNQAEADAVKAGTAVKAQTVAMDQATATSEWDKKPIGEMNPVEGVPGWGFVKTSTGGGQLVELPEEKKIPFDGRKSFEEDGVLWTWSDRSKSYMGKPAKAKGFDVDPMIWLTMTPEQQQAMVTAFTSGKKPEGEKQLSTADQQALDWANANPNDPRAAKIKAKLGR